MVRYFLTDLRGNPIYSFAQRRLRRNNLRLTQHARNLSQHLQQIEERQQTTQSSNAFVTTTLVCMVRNRAWENVLKRVETHPQEVHVMDGATGTTVLHTACRLNPPAAVVKALAVTPALARQPNIEGATALHVAASHRCSAEALRALLDACRTTTGYYDDARDDKHTTASSTTDDAEDDDDKHTSPTADLSRMGRAPIHYACMSYRGLEIDAFCLLLDATLKEGNVWVYENRPQTDDHLSEGFSAAQSCSGLVNEESSSVMEDNVDDFDDDLDKMFRCEFENEADRELHQQNTDDLTVEDQHQTERPEPLRVLVNVMGMKDATGQTPLGLLFRRYRERVRCVINTVDHLRSEQDNPDRAALVAAVRVHADLGELWEKARWIVARLTEERLQRERDEEEARMSDDDDCEEKKAIPEPPKRLDATSRRATYFGSATSSFYDATRFAEPPSPAEAALAQEAASWAVEQHQGSTPTDDDVLPIAPNVSTGTAMLSKHRHSPNGISGRQFRIVHASVGLTGYGCPPELIRLAISMHPHQVMEMDEEGNLPLHIAVTAASYLATAHHAALDHPGTMAAAAAAAAAASDNADDLSVISDAAMSFFSSATVSQTTNPFDKVIKILLQQYPEAARIPQGKTGRLPLVLAVESRHRTWADGIRTLLNAYPPALHDKKIIPAELYPNVLSLVARNGHSCSLDFASGGGIINLLPVLGEAGGDAAASDQQPSQRSKRSKRAIRQEACSRSTLFEMLRTKPEYLTKFFDFENQHESSSEPLVRRGATA